MLQHIVKDKQGKVYEIADVTDNGDYVCCQYPYDGEGYFYVDKKDVGHVEIITDSGKSLGFIPPFSAPRNSER